MLKPALLYPTLLAREPRGPPGPGSEPPHPGAFPLQLPRQRKQQQKERARRRAPSSGHSPGSGAARVTGSEVGREAQRKRLGRLPLLQPPPPPPPPLLHHPSSGHPHRSHRRCRCWGWGHCSRFILHRAGAGRGGRKEEGGRGSGEIDRTSPNLERSVKPTREKGRRGSRGGAEERKGGGGGRGELLRRRVLSPGGEGAGPGGRKRKSREGRKRRGRAVRGRAHCFGPVRSCGGVAVSLVGGAGGGARLPPWVLFDGLRGGVGTRAHGRSALKTGETRGIRGAERKEPRKRKRKMPRSQFPAS
ncbi:translation initiation factor IF-2-like [Zalophus californianus]|uniref:Translation initiation factor IF-2-like n=1 Tax=Zalophus californianus TaxID=9704 RepID=A0A6J2DWL6_ZALCA|nr:translation initiation factor IF-2-like [Zalophus californianus]